MRENRERRSSQNSTGGRRKAEGSVHVPSHIDRRALGLTGRRATDPSSSTARSGDEADQQPIRRDSRNEARR